MGSRSKPIAWSLLRSISQYRDYTVRAAASAVNLINDEVNLARSRSTGGASSTSERSTLKKGQSGSVWFYAAAGLMAFSTTAVGTASPHTDAEEKRKDSGHMDNSSSRPRVIFVLGGPGSGKGTQCAKIVDNYGFVHLSAGDLLRAEIKSGSPNGNMIQDLIKDGKIVPSEVTVNLLKKAMNEAATDSFIIDGFPRNEENRLAFEKVVSAGGEAGYSVRQAASHEKRRSHLHTFTTGIEPEFILYFDCPLEELEKRLLGRNEGRTDDNIDTIRKRFKVFLQSSLPVIDYYDKLGKTRKVNATRSREEVFKAIEPLFKPYVEG